MSSYGQPSDFVVEEDEQTGVETTVGIACTSARAFFWLFIRLLSVLYIRCIEHSGFFSTGSDDLWNGWLWHTFVYSFHAFYFALKGKKALNTAKLCAPSTTLYALPSTKTVITLNAACAAETERSGDNSVAPGQLPFRDIAFPPARCSGGG